MLTVNELSCYRENKNIRTEMFSPLSFSCPSHSINVIVGPSGAGKSTLLQTLMGCMPTYEGEILLNGMSLKDSSRKAWAKNVGMVFQEFHLFPHLSVLENCTQPLRVVEGWSRKEATQKAEEWLERLGILSLRDRRISDLSGGQKQRVALGRTLAKQIKLLLLDEPSSALDCDAVDNFCEILMDLKGNGIGILLSTHDQSLIQKWPDAQVISVSPRS